MVQADDVVTVAQSHNLEAAARAATVLSRRSSNSLGRADEEQAFYSQIVQLSYTGDVRMRFGEDPNKVHNIARAKFPLLKEIYNNYRAAVAAEPVRPLLTSTEGSGGGGKREPWLRGDGLLPIRVIAAGSKLLSPSIRGS